MFSIFEYLNYNGINVKQIFQKIVYSFTAIFKFIHGYNRLANNSVLNFLIEIR